MKLKVSIFMWLESANALMNLIKVAETQFINITLDGDEVNTNYTGETKCLLEIEADKANHQKVI